MKTYRGRMAWLWAVGGLAAVVVSPIAARAAVPQPGARPSPALGSAVLPSTVLRSTVVPSTAYRWPLDGTPRLVRRFDPPPQRWASGHRGVDLAAAAGTVVRAAGPGVVVFAGHIAGRGVVSVEHAGGLRTTYEPLEPAVSSGQRVAAGDPLGTLAAGHAGCPQPACLHWGLRRGAEYLDPLALLGLVRVRLLPLR
jgi:murein DD-endopeptidase MepM/ murein hydrolase activator NlpD